MLMNRIIWAFLTTTALTSTLANGNCPGTGTGPNPPTPRKASGFFSAAVPLDITDANVGGLALGKIKSTRNDILLTSWPTTGTSHVYTFQNNGDKTFTQSGVNVTGEVQPLGIAALDLLNTGVKTRDDFAVAGNRSDKIYFFINDPSGIQSSSVAGGVGPSSIVKADMTGDKFNDLVVLNPSQSKVSVFRIDIAGTDKGVPVVKATQLGPFDTGAAPVDLDSIDVDGDGAVDIVTANGFGASGSVNVLINDGKGNLDKTSVKSIVLGGKTPRALIAKDLNKDGIPDIATANSDGTVTVLLGLGNREFGNPNYFNYFGAGAKLTDLAAADYTGDGYDDIVTTDETNGKVIVFVNNGKGNFTASADLSSVLDAPQAVVTGDLNGDGKYDVVVASKIKAVKNDASGVVSPASVRVYVFFAN